MWLGEFTPEDEALREASIERKWFLCLAGESV